MSSKFIELHTAKFRLFSDGELWVYDHRRATKLNKLLKTYEKGEYSFKAGEEARFKLSQNAYIGAVQRILGIKSTQIVKP